MATDTFEFVATDVPVLESDTYLAQLERMELRQSKTTFMRDDGTVAPSEYYSWKFSLLDGDHDGEYVYTNSSTSFGRRAKMRKWVAAILNREVETGDRVTLDDLLGVPCRLVVKKERDNEGVWANVIADILPATGAKTASSNKAAAPTPSEQGPLFEDEGDARTAGTETAGLIRRFEAVKQKLGWRPAAYDGWLKIAMGWTPEAVTAQPGPVKFHKMTPQAQRKAVEELEKAAEKPEQYDEDGDLRF